MTLPQPNERAAALRLALDIVNERIAKVRRWGDAAEADGEETLTHAFAVYNLNEITDTLSDQLIEAGGFLGDEPEPEDVYFAFIIDRQGEILAKRLIGDGDSMEPDDYANHYAQMCGFDLDRSGLIPDGCEDFSVRIAIEADCPRAWDARNYAFKGE
jgi:hypothetical protein